jgi:heptaprenylglyceryl phosphate synthase
LGRPCAAGEGQLGSHRATRAADTWEVRMHVLDRFKLDGRRLFITGGSRGLGREMALAMAEAGADVVLTGRTASSLEATAADIRARGREALAIRPT